MSFLSRTRFHVIIIFISLSSFLYAQENPGTFIQDTVISDYEKNLVVPPINKDQILGVFYDENGNEIIKVEMPGKPPEVYRASVARISSSAVLIDDVPAYDWSFGCTPTAAAMIAGYYDRNGYPYIYTGPANNGVMPLNNSYWGSVAINGENRKQCPLSASRNGLDGRTTRGHIDDYWINYGNPGPDPFIINSWTEHSYGDCLADYMRTSQSVYKNNDGSTSIYYFSTGTGLRSSNPDDGIYGMKLFFEARGYTVTNHYTQLIYGYNGNTLGFTFNNFKQEIDNGHLVMLQIQGHSMLGIGYDNASNTVYLHDTWDYSSHSMTWGGSYAGMAMWGVSVIHLLPPSSLTITGAGPGNGKVKINNSEPEPLPYNGSFSGPVIIEAVPDSGNVFVEWAGDLQGPQNPVTFQMDMAKNITAEFEPVMNIQVSLPDTSVNIGSSFIIPVRISSSDSVSIYSYDLKLIYDTLRLNFTGLDISGTLTDEEWMIDYNNYQGEILLAAYSPAAIAGNGKLLNLCFSASDTVCTTPLEFTYFRFNNGNPVASPLSGCNIELTEPDICGDINENGIVQETDASGLLEHVLDITPLESEQALRNADADMNGFLQAYDCALILQYVSGIANPVPTCFDPEVIAVPSENEEILVRIPDTVALNGKMKIPIYVTGIQPDDNILSFQFRITFDDSILNAYGVVDSGSVLPEGWNVMCNTDTPGEIYVAGYGTETADGDGPLLYLVFNVKEINYSDLFLEEFIFNDGNPATEIKDGSVPVELLSFSGLFSGDKIELKWTTVTETNNFGFEIERKYEGSSWEKTGFINGAGNSTVKMNYSYSDMNLKSGNYMYRLRQIDYNGSFNYSNEIAVKADLIPVEFALYQNYPNPFNPATTIRYDLPEKSKVRLSVFNLLGNETAVLVDEIQPGGTYQVEFNALSLPSGVYFYRIQAEKYSSIKKLILVK